MNAAQFGNIDTVRILLEHGADINTKDKIGKIFIFHVTLLTHFNYLLRKHVVIMNMLS